MSCASELSIECRTFEASWIDGVTDLVGHERHRMGYDCGIIRPCSSGAVSGANPRDGLIVEEARGYSTLVRNSPDFDEWVGGVKSLEAPVGACRRRAKIGKFGINVSTQFLR